MMKKLLLTLTVAAVTGVASAAPISPEAALGRLHSDGPSKARAMHDLVLSRTLYTANDVAAAYIFVPSNSKGFTILSADDAIAPVIGYSDSGNIDVDNLPPAMEWWIGECSRKARTLQALGRQEANVKALSGMEAVQPLCKTVWNQDAPYNDDCPNVKGVKAPTGCVATSIAQAMKYFNYPEVGTGSISYVDQKSLVKRTMDFSRTKFKWDLMLDNYSRGDYTDDQAGAVSKLMKAAGYAVQMGYGADVSGAQSWRIPLALIDYFGYDKGTYYTERSLYSSDEWTRMIYDNIKNIGPVIYDGSAIEGGHSFICDGYDGNGYFHFNWGWGGMSDGYYVLDSLLPGSQGIGGAGEGGFNYSQGAVLGMRKPVENSPVNYDRLKISGTVDAKLSGNDLVVSVIGGEYNIGSGNVFTGWGNGSFKPINVSVGVSFASVNAPASPVKQVQGKLVSNFSGTEIESIVLGAYSILTDYSASFRMPEGLADGDYKVTLVCRQNNVENAPWLPVFALWGYENYCMVNVSGGKYTVSNVKQPVIKVENCEFMSPLYVGRDAFLKCTFKNDNDSQVTLNYIPVLIRDNAVQYQCDYMLVTVDAGQSMTKEMKLKFYAVGQNTGVGTYTLGFMDMISGKLIGTYGDYEMTSVSGALKVSVESFEVKGASQKDVTVGTRTFKDTYVVSGTTDVDVFMKYLVESGYLDYNVKLVLAAYDVNTNKFVTNPDPIYENKPYIGAGHSAEAAVTVDMSHKDLTTVYRVNAGYVVSGKTTGIGTIYFAFDLSGVDDLEVDAAGEEAVYYNLQGVRVDNPVKGQLLVRRKGAVAEKVVF